MRSIGTQCPRRPLGDKKILSEKESGRPLEFLSDNYADAMDICRTFCSNTPHPLEFYADVRQNVRRTSVRMSVRRISVGRPPECPSHPPECLSDVRQNVRCMSVRMCRTSARMSNGCLSDVRNVRTEKCL